MLDGFDRSSFSSAVVGTTSRPLTRAGYQW